MDETNERNERGELVPGDALRPSDDLAVGSGPVAGEQSIIPFIVGAPADAEE